MGTTGQSITLANSIIGVGILAMPFCFQQCGVLLATVILLLMGLVSRLCCYFLLKSALLARRRNFEFLAFHVFGSAGKLAVEVGIIGFLMGTCIAYFVVVGDLGPQIISKMLNINQSDMLRTSIMVIVSLVCVLPLGLLRNVDSLSNVSAATIGFYFCLVMKVIAEAASQLLTGDWQSRVEMWKPSGVLQCVPIFSMALFCQTQLFEIFESLPSLSLEKMNVVTKNAINICTGVYFTLGVFGYIAFSAQTISGNILMSLSPTMASDVIKLGFVMSLAFSFPLIIFPCRASLYSLLYKKVHSSLHDHIINQSIPERSFRCITVGIVAASLCVSLLLPNIELVLGLVGSTIGVLVCLVFPAACFLHLTFKNTSERLLAKGILILGLIIMVLGTYANLQAAENQIDKYDEKFITKERIDKMVEDFFNQQADNVMAKPDINVGVNIETNEAGEIIKDSVVQPPNPVPPESQSNEKINNIDLPKLKEVPPEPIKETVDKVSETHPKNLNKLNDVKQTNGENKEVKHDKEKTAEENKPNSAEDKINLIKQQQLIETIKQHGEEQKELIKEQKEILGVIQELKNNKKEADKVKAKKIAVESIKEIANIAIQSLAGVSDKPGSVNGDNNIDKVADEAVQEIAQKAVETIEAIKEIAEKPEAIKPNLPKVPIVPANNVQNVIPAKQPNNSPQVIAQNNPNIIKNINNVSSQSAQNSQNQQVNVQSVNDQAANMPQLAQGALNLQSNVQSSANIGQQSANVGQLSPNVSQQSANVAQQPQNVGQQSPNVGQAPPNVVQPPSNIQPVASSDQQAVNNLPSINNVPVANNAQPSINNAKHEINNAQVVNNKEQPSANNIQPPLSNIQNVAKIAQSEGNAQNANNIIPNQPALNNVDINQPNLQNDIKIVKEHSHGPDEPQSYKEGEDSQKKINSLDVAQNVPLPLAVGNSRNDGNVAKANVQNDIDSKKDDNAAPIRQKREVVDCTEKTILQPEDKEICKKLIGNHVKTEIDDGNVKDILTKKIDFNVELPNNLQMHQNVLHHISRSLKSIEDPSKDTR